jgi:hypothetical protein
VLSAPEVSMLDVLMLLIGIGAFAACWGYMLICEGL